MNGVIYEIILMCWLQTEGQPVALTESRGIDILGNIMEASILSENRNLYGDLHNLGHVAIALSHDPDHRHLVCRPTRLVALTKHNKNSVYN